MADNDAPTAHLCGCRALDIGLKLPHLLPVVARSYASLILTSAAQRQAKLAKRYKRLALNACEQLSELGLLSYTLTAAAVTDASQGQWEAGTSSLKDAAQWSQKIGDQRQWEEATSHLAHLEFYRGDFKSSLELYQRAIESATERGDKQIRNRCNAGLAAVYLATGDLESASALLKQTNSFGQKALALLRQGSDAALSMSERESYCEGALEEVNKVTDRFKGQRTKYYTLKAFVSTTDVVLQLYERAIASNNERVSGSANEAVRPAVVALNDANELGTKAHAWIGKLSQFAEVYAVAQPRMLLFKAMMSGLEGSPSAAKSLAKRSARTAHKMRMPYDEALATLYLAKLGRGKERAKALATAQEAFERLGAKYDLQRCHQLAEDAA